MKIERRGYSVFIAHNGTTIFANKHVDGTYSLKISSRVTNEKDVQYWVTTGEIDVRAEDFKQ